MYRLQDIEKDYQKTKLLPLKAGDQVRVHSRITEGNRERIQVYEGVVLRIHGSGTRKMMTVRKVSYGVAVERIFPMHSPIVAQIEFVSRGKVRQSRIYYMRNRFGKKARMEREMNFSLEEKASPEKASPKKASPEKASAEKASKGAPSEDSGE